MGKARSGKDTVADIFVQCGFLKYSLADKVKWVAREIFGWNCEKDEKGRKLLIAIGNKMREIDEKCWIEALTIELGREGQFNAVIPDIRYKNEAKWIREMKGILIRVERPELDDSDEEWRKSKSETDLDDWDDWDYVISTNDLKLLKLMALEVRAEILEEMIWNTER